MILTLDFVIFKLCYMFHVLCFMYDLITIGDITIDLFFKGEELTQKDDRFFLAIGGKYLADEFHETLGGGAANVAVGASHYGLNTAVLGKIGENVFKQIIIQKLIKKGVSTEFLLLDKDYLNISSILLSYTGDRSIIHYATPHETLDISEIMMNKLTRTTTVYMGNLPGISISERSKLLSFFKKKNIKIALNFGRQDCAESLAKVGKLIEYADILVLNKHEFADLVKKKIQTINFEKDCARLLPSKLKASKMVLVITCAEEGSFAYHEEKVFYEKAVKPTKLVDATGAGDAYTSGFLSTFIKSNDISAAMQRGSENAARILAKIGAQ